MAHHEHVPERTAMPGPQTQQAPLQQYQRPRQMQPRQADVSGQERWLSLALGSALLVVALRRRSFPVLLLAPAGAALVYRGVSGQHLQYERLPLVGRADGAGEIHVEKSVTVGKSPMEAYNFWRQLENLPAFMTHLETVEQLGDGRSRWHARIPGRLPFHWEAEITEDRPGELIAWRTLPGSSVEHHGQVRFVPAPGDYGTEVKATIQYRAPAGVAGELFARLTNAITSQQIKDDIGNFKHIIETGEIPTIEGQPSGRDR